MYNIDTWDDVSLSLDCCFLARPRSFIRSNMIRFTLLLIDIWILELNLSFLGVVGFWPINLVACLFVLILMILEPLAVLWRLIRWLLTHYLMIFVVNAAGFTRAKLWLLVLIKGRLVTTTFVALEIFFFEESCVGSVHVRLLHNDQLLGWHGRSNVTEVTRHVVALTP